MNHLGSARIETPRLTLRRFELDDAEAMFRNWATDPEVTKYLTWPCHGSVELTRKLIAMWREECEKPDVYQWAIVLKDESPEPIGSISVVHLNENTSAVEIGYCIGTNWWGRGIMTEALSALIDFFFTQVGALRVEARHDPRNPASGAVMRKCGMTEEGTLRQADRNNQGICDVTWYGILAGEYRK